MTQNEKIRTFIAIEIDRGLIPDSLFRRVNSQSSLRPVRTEALHLTLEFFGEIETDYVARIEYVMDNVSFKVFSIDFRGLGAFPDPNRARVLFLKAESNPHLNKIRSSILNPLGKNGDGEFVPHATLARAKHPLNLTEIIEEFSVISFTSMVKEVKLFASELTQRGPVYRVMKKIVSDMQ